jgi:hypothetical protein
METIEIRRPLVNGIEVMRDESKRREEMKGELRRR